MMISPRERRTCQLLGLCIAVAGCGRRVAAPPAVPRPEPSSATTVDPPVSRTFSIVAIDPETSVCGAAVASKYPAVGSVVPAVRGGVGAFCTQHMHNPAWRAQAIELLGQGKPPGEILSELVRDDPRAAMRQLAIVDAQGRTAQHNPTNAPAGSRWWGSAAGRYYACQGNTLVGRQVIAAMATAYETTEGTIADRLMAALVAGDCAGGDHRGRLAAALLVDKPGGEPPWLELRVDASDDAVIELARKYVELEHDAKGPWSARHTPWQNPCPDRGEPKPPADNDPR